jgi:hypothetical protein
MRRLWHRATDKLLAEQRCRACGSTERLERAHVIGRERDRHPPVGWDGPWEEPYLVHPDRIIPLCWRCHRAQHERKLDIPPLLTTAEQVQAVADAGSIELARKRLAPSAYPSKVAA